MGILIGKPNDFPFKTTKKNMKYNLENGDVDEYDDDEWDVK